MSGTRRKMIPEEKVIDTVNFILDVFSVSNDDIRNTVSLFS